jgi:hypothetical protein
MLMTLWRDGGRSKQSEISKKLLLPILLPPLLLIPSTIAIFWLLMKNGQERRLPHPALKAKKQIGGTKRGANIDKLAQKQRPNWNGQQRAGAMANEGSIRF